MIKCLWDVLQMGKQDPDHHVPLQQIQQQIQIQVKTHWRGNGTT